MLEGVVKHNGPIADESRLHAYIADYNSKHDLDLKNFPSIESQISAISDDIAYNNHDIEDGLRAELFSVEELFSLPLVGKIYQEILAKYPQIKRELLVGEAKKLLTLAMVIDVIDNTQKNILENKIDSEKAVRCCGKFLVNFSPEMEIAHQSLKKFLMQNMYRHSTVNRMTANAKKIISGLFDFYMTSPSCLPDERAEVAVKIFDKKQLAIFISDYIAGMTDRFAIKEFEQLV